MPTAVLEAYVSRLPEVEAQRRYDAVVAASVPHWTPESAQNYLNDLWKVIEQAQSRVSRVLTSGKAVYDDLMGWFRGLGFGVGSGVEGD
jgi:hypothetical protein